MCLLYAAATQLVLEARAETHCVQLEGHWSGGQ